jgi:type II secretory pathway predicted ATPase ExeA
MECPPRSNPDRRNNVAHNNKKKDRSMEAHEPTLARKAFGDNANKSLIVTYESHRQAHHYLSSALAEASGIALLQGPHGAGKTTIINELIPQLRRDCSVAVFDGANRTLQLDARHVLSQFGIETVGKADEWMLQTLDSYVMQQVGSGTTPVLILDNADRVDPSVLSLLNWLADLNVRGRWALRFVLTGTEHLAELVTDFSMRHFERRHPTCFEMNPLSKREAVHYLRNKLISAGCENAEDMLPLDTCEALHDLSGGWPGRLDELGLQTIRSWHENKVSHPGPRITVTTEGKTIAAYALCKSETIVGRDGSADIVIDDACVSKHHVMLKVDETAVTLIDLNSTNGTRVNSREIMQSLVQNDDVITVGPFELRIENLPAISDKMAEILRQEDTVTLDNPDDIRRSRALRNIQHLRAGKEIPVKPLAPPSGRPSMIRTSETAADWNVPSTLLDSI